jgi:tape measure domain-containing protein
MSRMGGAIGGAYVEFGGRDTGWSAEARRAERGLRNLQVAGAGVGSTFASIGATLGRSLAPLAALFGIGSAAIGASRAVRLAAEFEQTSIAFKVMVGDAERAERLLGRLQVFANETPFNFAQSVRAARVLLATGSGAESIEGELRVLGNLAAGVATPLDELALVYSQIRAAGRLLTQDLNQFASRGIPLLQALADMYGVTTAETRKMGEQGRISFEDVRRALIRLQSEGGTFADVMKKQEGTTLQLYSALGDSIDQMLTRVGNLIIDWLHLNELMKGSIAGLDTFREAMFGTSLEADDQLKHFAVRVGELQIKIASVVEDAAQTAVSVWALAIQEIAGLALRTAGRVQVGLVTAVTAVSTAAVTGVTTAMSQIVGVLSQGGLGVATMLQGMAERDLIKIALGSAQMAGAVSGVGDVGATIGDAVGKAVSSVAGGGADVLGGTAADAAGAAARVAAGTAGLVSAFAARSVLGMAGGWLAMSGLGDDKGGKGDDAEGGGGSSGLGGRFMGLVEGFDAVQRAVFGTGDPANRTARATEQAAETLEELSGKEDKVAGVLEQIRDSVRGGVVAVYA